ncbi:MAG: hypothetical protein LBQ89_01785 [Treponema sp.]|jgi:hypothetical protein|nr:hypothetical protein [Treponema sp.]
MRKFFIAIVFFAISGSLTAQITVSGILDSSVSLTLATGDAPASPDFSFGIEEYANLRFQSRLRDRAAVYGAVNLIAAAGDYALNLAGMGLTIGDNFIAGIELERLYFRLNGKYTDFDGGLMRLPFGYGQVWGPSDFLNPQNPLKPDARERAVLGAALSWYPNDDLKTLVFGAAPRYALSREGKGSHVGLSLDWHWNTASVQVLYSFETPKDGSNYGIHRLGLSVKADLEISLVMDALYSYNHEAGTGLDGLSFSIGADYSFLNGNLIVLAEYLYNGETSSTSYGGLFFNRHYLYTGLTWLFNDYTNASFAMILDINNVSFTPVITVNHDLFQGAILAVTAQIPLDRNFFSGLNCSARLRLRF